MEKAHEKKNNMRKVVDKVERCDMVQVAWKDTRDARSVRVVATVR